MSKVKNTCMAIFNTIPFFYYAFSAGFLYWADSILMYSATRELMLCFGLCFAKEIGMMQLSHVTNTNHEPLDTVGFFVLSSLVINAWLNTLDLGVNEYSLLIGLTLTAAASYAHFVVNIADDICKELRINIFSVKRKL